MPRFGATGLALLHKLRNRAAVLERHVAGHSAALSYSQSGEDLIVAFVLQALGVRQPRYLDIGAHAPAYLSNTYLFYLRGASGVCVEPDPGLCDEIRALRPRDVCLNAGVGDGTRDAAEYYVLGTPTLSTFDSKNVAALVASGAEKVVRTLRVPMIGVEDLFTRHFLNGVNFVSLDIEGGELAVLEQLDFTRWRPEVICIETVSYSKNGLGEKDVAIPALMAKRDYMSYADTNINTIFVDRAAWTRKRE